MNELTRIAIPKGENRAVAESWLASQGLPIPELPARCLHWQR